MLAEKPIDDLIEAGWHVVESDFDESAFQNWRKHAFYCLTSLLGPDHADTQFFGDRVHMTFRDALNAGHDDLKSKRGHRAVSTFNVS